MMRRFGLVPFFLIALFFLPSSAFAAREASFTDPGVSIAGSAAGNDAIIVEPKSDIDTGETFLNVSRRVTVFFINQSSSPVNVIGMSANSDGNVKADIVSDDCSKGARQIASASRCAVSVEVTPSSPGPWTAELLMTHDGPGRIARVKLSGKTSAKSGRDKKEAGLSLSSSTAKPIDFGEVTIGQDKAVRSALMVNDSAETIALMSIDIIAADNGLKRLDQGCTVDMELKPGESCPVTMLWQPTAKGVISTDLIIRHTGQLGFAVIPIRGTAKDPKSATDNALMGKGAQSSKGKSDADKVPMPTSAEEIEKLSKGQIPQIDGALLPQGVTGTAASTTPAAPVVVKLQLIGTVGNRALILKPSGETTVAALGEEVSLDEKSSFKVLAISPKSADILLNGKKKTLLLGAAQELISKAEKDADASSSAKNKKKKFQRGGDQ